MYISYNNLKKEKWLLICLVPTIIIFSIKVNIDIVLLKKCQIRLSYKNNKMLAFYFPSLWCDVMSFYWGVGDLVETLLLLFLINDNFHYHSRNETETKWNQNRRWKRIFELNTYLTTYMKNNKNIPLYMYKEMTGVTTLLLIHTRIFFLLKYNHLIFEYQASS